MISRIISFLFLLLVTNEIPAQQVKINGDTCSPAVFSLSSTISPGLIKWYFGGNILCIRGKYEHNGVVVGAGNGRGSNEDQMNKANGLFVDDSDNVYVADFANLRIQKFRPGSNKGLTVAKNISDPMDVFADKKGNLYVTEQGFSRVLKFIPGQSNGIVVGNASRSASLLSGVFVDSSGNIYASDYGYNVVWKWAPDSADNGVVVAGKKSVFGGNTADKLHGPQGIYVDKRGNIFIADYYNQRIQMWVPGATEGVTVAYVWPGYENNLDKLYYPLDVFLDSMGVMYITNSDGKVLKWRQNAKTGITVAGGNGGGTDSDQLIDIRSAACNKKGDVFVSNDYNGNSDIKKFSVSEFTDTLQKVQLPGYYSAKAVHKKGDYKKAKKIFLHLGSNSTISMVDVQYENYSNFSIVPGYDSTATYSWVFPSFYKIIHGDSTQQSLDAMCIGSGTAWLTAKVTTACGTYIDSLLLTCNAPLSNTNSRDNINSKATSTPRILPNPALDNINLYGLSAEIENTVRIFDMLGRKVYESKCKKSNVIINIEGLKTGIYVVNISNANEHISLKFLKQ